MSDDELEAQTALLAHPTRAARADAAATLGRRGDERAVEPLIELLESSPIPGEDETAARPRAGGEKFEGPAGLSVTITLTRIDPEAEGRARAGADRVAAVEALAAIGGDEALDALVKFYRTEAMHPFLLQAVARAIARIDPAAARELLEPDLESASGDERIAALAGLTAVEDAELAGPIAALLGDDVYGVREAATAALASRPLEAYRETLRTLLEGRSEQGARAALQVLSTRLKNPLLGTALGDLAAPIAALASCREHADLCVAASRVLARAGAFAQLRPHLIEYLEDGEPWRRRHAATLIHQGLNDRAIGGDFLDAALTGSLASLLADQAADVCARATAARALLAGGWNPEPGALQPRDADEAARAYLLLILCGRDEAIPLLEEAMARQGSTGMYRMFSSSGRPELKMAAEQWLAGNAGRDAELREKRGESCGVLWNERRHLQPRPASPAERSPR